MNDWFQLMQIFLTTNIQSFVTNSQRSVANYQYDVMLLLQRQFRAMFLQTGSDIIALCMAGVGNSIMY